MIASAAHDGRRRIAAAREPVRLEQGPASPPSVPATPALSLREREGLALLATGQLTRASADQRGVSTKTLDEQSLNLRQHLHLACLNELIVYAVYHNWYGPEGRHGHPQCIPCAPSHAAAGGLASSSPVGHLSANHCPHGFHRAPEGPAPARCWQVRVRKEDA
jgi:hypothetical protein